MSCPKGTKLNKGEDTCGIIDDNKFRRRIRRKLVEDKNTKTTMTNDIIECADYCYQNRCNVFSTEIQVSDSAGAGDENMRATDVKCIISTNPNQKAINVDIQGNVSATTYQRIRPLPRK